MCGIASHASLTAAATQPVRPLDELCRQDTIINGGDSAIMVIHITQCAA